ncbi:hypothetical protein LJR090_003091 [Bosea sp. LjRoot90]|uniref:hypothetical protein n=1 Tax=Bosea sp. LjRoot90 TaxID=3342342 RepID=UPI003ECE68C6
MCVPVGYETWTFYSIAAVLSAVYFFLLSKTLRHACVQAIDPTPYQASIFLLGAGAYRLAGFKVDASTGADDLRLFGETKRRLAFLSLGCGVVGITAIVATLHCHMVVRKVALWPSASALTAAM